MKAKLKAKKIKCGARDCDMLFVPRVDGQKFHTRKCYNRESQRTYRERQKAGVTA